MPDRLSALQLGLLLLAVPVQYFISRYYSVNEAERSYTIKKIFTGVVDIKDKYLSWQSWERWCLTVLNNIKQYGGSGSKHHHQGAADVDDNYGESPAVEVMNYRDPNGYFAASTEPRTVRPGNVNYRVGQVIRHKRWGYRGVIIGWDPKARAPDHWLAENHPPEKKHWGSQPNYAILVDTRDRMSPQMTYVPQENLEILTNTQIIHPHLDSYFEGFDGAQYLPRPSLKHTYPKD